jgi:predicted  nucleic acid-binding Zn-ribbon protein
MKNEIKRLKQEVITLMSRLQCEEGIQSQSPSSTPQMTSIMHQYVSEEIDKQTKLEMEILKLKDRINHLQDGIKHYSSSETHLRMIIVVLEDKLARLKAVESRMSFNLE